MAKHFERELPQGYHEAMTVDAKDKKTILLLNLAALIPLAAIITLAAVLIRPTGFFESYTLVRNLIFIVVLLAYIVLHELVHGAAYKALTGEKLTFGVSLTVAYCGVPNIYVYRKAAMIALLSPFVVFTAVFAVAAVLLHDPWDKMYAAILLATHVGGCVCDLYDTLLYMTRFRAPDTLMRDTGPKQTFYVK